MPCDNKRSDDPAQTVLDACKALEDGRHLIQHHSSLVVKYVTTLVAAILPAVDALRSQTAHAALLMLQAMPPSWHPCMS